MADRPFGPWRFGDADARDVDPDAPTVEYVGPPLPGSADYAFWSLYTSLADRGFDLAVCERTWDVFKAACALGVGRKITAKPGASGAPSGDGSAVAPEPSSNLTLMRLRAAERGEKLDGDSIVAPTPGMDVAMVARYMAGGQPT